MRFVALAFFILIAFPVLAATSDCADFLSTRKAHFDEVITQLHEFGLRELTSSYDQGLVQVQFSSPHFWQRLDLRQHLRSFTGTRVLNVRRVEWRNDEERQRAIWHVAEALYRLETAKSLWNPRWTRAQRLDHVTLLQDEMYRLLDLLPAVRVEDVLPSQDPSRYWGLPALFLRDISPRQFPNLSDRDLRSGQDIEGWAKALRARYDRASLVHAYLDWIKRGATVAVVGSALALGGSWVYDELKPAPPQLTLEEQLQREPTPEGRARIYERAIREEEGQVVHPDTAKIEQLQKDYHALLDANPHLKAP
jgi:hypothetical protein